MVWLTENGRPPTNIKVCDALMGSGKTSAAIRYMNAHPERRFIYVAPLVSETQRIADACPALNFALPEESREERKTKTVDLRGLLRANRSVAITHVLFGLCDDETCDIFCQHHYTLIIDEAVDVLQHVQMKKGDMAFLLQHGVLEQHDGFYEVNQDMLDKVRCSSFSDISRYSASHKLVRIAGDDAFYWQISDRMLHAADEVIVMTYMFERTVMHAFLEMNGHTYQNIYVAHPSPDIWEFSDQPAYIPAYARYVSRLINIVDDENLNNIGSAPFSLSHSWYRSNFGQHRKNKQAKASGKTVSRKDMKADGYRVVMASMRNFFERLNGFVPANDRIWTCYSDERVDAPANGYKNSYLSFNAKGTNEFADRHYLSYPVNVFMITDVKHYLQRHGTVVTDEDYALTSMVQWIWRSAIRNGEPVTLYLPSKRMRNLLTQWLHDVEQTYQSYIEQKSAAGMAQTLKEEIT